MPLVIVISGLAGSGKTTLGEKLNKLQNVNVVELDDIDDKMHQNYWKNNGQVLINLIK